MYSLAFIRGKNKIQITGNKTVPEQEAKFPNSSAKKQQYTYKTYKANFAQGH